MSGFHTRIIVLKHTWFLWEKKCYLQLLGSSNWNLYKLRGTGWQCFQCGWEQNKHETDLLSVGKQWTESFANNFSFARCEYIFLPLLSSVNISHAHIAYVCEDRLYNYRMPTQTCDCTNEGLRLNVSPRNIQWLLEFIYFFSFWTVVKYIFVVEWWFYCFLWAYCYFYCMCVCICVCL